MEQEVFLGKASRLCKTCGDQKLYKEFDAKGNCTSCAWERYQRELEDMEERTLENERAYEEAMERQELIDECLRALDE